MPAKAMEIQMTCNWIIGNLPAVGSCSPDSKEHWTIR